MKRLNFNESRGELWFSPCRFDGSLGECRNPFTGMVEQIPRSGGLTSEEQRSVAAVLEPFRTPQSANAIEVADGGVALFEVYPNSVVIEPTRVRPTLGLAGVVFDVLLAANWCLWTDEAIVVTNVENARHRPREDARVPREFYEAFPKDVVVVESAAALGAALGWNAKR